MIEFLDLNNIKFADKKLLHKNKNENVHIYNLRRNLPRKISAHFFEKEILTRLDEAQKDLILFYYIKHSVNSDNNRTRENDEYYVLRSLPYKIHKNDFETIFSQMLTHPLNRKLVHSIYKKNNSSEYYILSGDVSTDEELKILKNLFGQILLITDTEQTEISEILEKIFLLPKDDIFHANLHVDPNHYYFFEHQVDHVPGIMLIETARQMFTACAHKFGQVPHSGFSFTLNNLDINFNEYIWLSLPTKIELKLTNASYSDKGHWILKCSCEVKFYQEFRLKAHIKISGAIIESETIENFIINKLIHDKAKFNTPSIQNCIAYLSDIESSICYFGKIIDISLKHILVEVKESVTFQDSELFEFKVKFSDTYKVLGECTLSKYQIVDKQCFAIFRITDINPIDRNNLIEIIKGLAHIREQRGIL